MSFDEYATLHCQGLNGEALRLMRMAWNAATTGAQTMKPTTRHNLTIQPADYAELRRLGNGNASKGIRVLLGMAKSERAATEK